VSGHMGPSLIGSNTRFRLFCWIRIVAQCPDTWGRVHSVQIPDSDIFAGLELWHSVQTHGAESVQFKYRFRYFCWMRIVAQCPDTWDRVHSVQISDSDIFAGLELLHSVWTHGTESNWVKYPIPTFLLDENCGTVSRHMGPSPFSSNTDSDIFAGLELLHCVRTHGPESMWLKYPIPTFLLD